MNLFIKNMEGYQITINDSKIRVPIKEERKALKKNLIF
jgi:hypothetical protein